MPVLQVTNQAISVVGKRKSTPITAGVSFGVDAGEMFAIVGESGSGKSMTALSLVDLLPSGVSLTSGSIRYDDELVRDDRTSRLRDLRGTQIGMVFQDSLASLNPSMRVGAQIAESLKINTDLDSTARRDRVVEVLDLCGIPRSAERLNDYPHQFSGGMRQRVMIAMALACRPRLLIADEPTTALDVTTQRQVLDLIDRLRVELHMAVILVSHDLAVVAGRADRVGVMYAGELVESGVSRDVLAAPRHQYTRALLAASPERAVSHDTRLISIPGLPPAALSAPGCPFAARCAQATAECSNGPIPAVDDGARWHRCLHPGPPPERRAPDVPHDHVPAVAHPAEPTSLLELVDVSKTFGATRRLPFGPHRNGVQAVSGVSLAIAAGETVGLVGESGSGKTTLGRIAVALDQPDTGSVRFDTTEISGVAESKIRGLRSQFQYVFQDSQSSLDPYQTIESILSEPLTIHRFGSHREIAARVLSLLDDVGLPRSCLRRYPHEFSGGQRQRINLARALALEPSLIVADEPVSALDVSVQAQILNLIRDLQRARNLTLLVVSHDLAVVEYVSRRIAVMYLGKIVEVGPSAEIYRSPAHPYTRALLDSVPKVDELEVGTAVPLRGELPSPKDPPSGCRFRTRCPQAQDLCREVEPEHVPVGSSGRTVACHFPLTNQTS